jgi:hypothetical protein
MTSNTISTASASLATHCALCGEGYTPTLAITISDIVRGDEYRGAHDQCKRDHAHHVTEELFDG